MQECASQQRCKRSNSGSDQRFPHCGHVWHVRVRLHDSTRGGAEMSKPPILWSIDMKHILDWIYLGTFFYVLKIVKIFFHYGKKRLLANLGYLYERCWNMFWEGILQALNYYSSLPQAMGQNYLFRVTVLFFITGNSFKKKLQNSIWQLLLVQTCFLFLF